MIKKIKIYLSIFEPSIVVSVGVHNIVLECVRRAIFMSNRSVAVVSSDILDEDFVLGEVSWVCVTVDLDPSDVGSSSLSFSVVPSVKSVDWEIVLLVRSGDVVVEVAEEWSRVRFAIGVFNTIEGWGSPGLDSSSHVDRNKFGLVCVGVEFFFPALVLSEEVNDVVLVVVAHSFDTSPGVAVGVEIGGIWNGEGRGDGEHLNDVGRSVEFQGALMIDHLIVSGDPLASTMWGMVVGWPAVRAVSVGILSGVGKSDERSSNLHFSNKNGYKVGFLCNPH